MKILITGATGYIGRELVRILQDKFDLFVLVRSTSNISELLNLNCEIIKFTTNKEIVNILESLEVDGIIHFASSIIVEHNEEDIDILIDNNIKFGTFLLEGCKKSNVKWFINTGTFWQNYQDKEYNPVNLYAASKEAFENIAKFYTATSSLIFTTIKLNDTFGPNDTRAKIFNLWNKIANTGELLDMTKGEQFIDISYIEDIVSAYEIMINHLNSEFKNNFNNKTYAVKSNERMTLKELAKRFEQITNQILNINWGGRQYKEREVMIPLADIEIVPGWKQKYSLNDAIIKTLGVIK
jgi:nucleoside-diphosphate-sugar epimerase